MPLNSLLLLLALLVLAALFVARPLFTQEEDDANPANELTPWIAERERVLDALAELDADWQMGKVPEELYSAQRKQLLAKGAIAIKQIENAAPKKATVKLNDDQLEKMIAARRTKRKK